MSTQRMQTVSFQLPVEVIDALRVKAREDDRSLSRVLRRIVIDAVLAPEPIVARTDEEFLERIATDGELDDVVPAARRTRPLA